jgi:hypothetical protein
MLYYLYLTARGLDKLKLTKGKVSLQQGSQIPGFLPSLCIRKEVCTVYERLIAKVKDRTHSGVIAGYRSSKQATTDLGKIFPLQFRVENEFLSLKC